MAQNKHWEQDKEATVYIGNLDERVTDAIVWELMLQAGRIVNVHLPKDRVTQTHQGFGFVEFISEEDAEYAARIMNQIRLYGKPIRVNKASADKQKTFEVGAELFIGNLDPLVDEKTLYETFSAFGNLVAAPKIARDEGGISKGYGFVSYDCFEASDKAIESMNGQYLMNKEVSVQYAYKKDGKGERHGDQAERLLAAQARKNNVQIATQPLPPQLFAPTAPTTPVVPPSMVPQVPVTPQGTRSSVGITQMPMNMPPQQMPYQPVPPGQQAQNPPRPPTAPPTSQTPYQQGLPIQPSPVGLPPRPPPPAGFNATQAQQFHPQGYLPPQGVPPQQPSYGFPSQQPMYGSAPPPLPAGFAPTPGGRGQPPQMKPGYPPPVPPPAGFGAPAPGVGASPGYPPQTGYPGFGRGR